MIIMKTFLALPHGAMGLPAVCDCGISGSYSLTISMYDIFLNTICLAEPCKTADVVL